MIASNGFGIGSTVNKTVVVNAIPSITLSSSGASETYCVDEEIVLNASGANTYTWLPGSNKNASLSLTISLSTPTTYTVNGKSAEGCSSSKVISLIISECTGISNSKSDASQFEIYPNPANQFVKIRTKGISENKVEIELMDVSGKVIRKTTHQFKKDAKELEFDISELAKGIYFLDLKISDENNQKYKFVKE